MTLNVNGNLAINSGGSLAMPNAAGVINLRLPDLTHINLSLICKST
jgi:hypothetical protein